MVNYFPPLSFMAPQIAMLPGFICSPTFLCIFIFSLQFIIPIVSMFQWYNLQFCLWSYSWSIFMWSLFPLSLTLNPYYFYLHFYVYIFIFLNIFFIFLFYITFISLYYLNLYTLFIIKSSLSSIHLSISWCVNILSIFSPYTLLIIFISQILSVCPYLYFWDVWLLLHKWQCP